MAHTLLEMAQVGKFSNYKVYIYGGEGPVPHLHFFTVDNKISGCIRLDKPEYFVHGNHSDTLNHSDKKKFVEWISSNETPFKKFSADLTVYRYIVITWNENNENYRVDEDIEMPDYTQL